MRITAFNASPNGNAGNTYHLVEAVLKGAEEAGARTEYIDICRKKINYCIGCFRCHQTGTCVHDDDCIELLEIMKNSDGIIFASPNYCDSVTAQLKTLIDRIPGLGSFSLWESEKYGLSIVTAGNSADPIADYMNTTLQKNGINTVGKATAVMMEGPEAFEKAKTNANEMGKRLVAAIANKEAYPDQDESRRILKELAITYMTQNRELFLRDCMVMKEKGWIE